jgi:hypothetical protein
MRLLWLDIGQGKRVRYHDSTLDDWQRNEARQDRGEEIERPEYNSEAQRERSWRLFETAKAAKN